MRITILHNAVGDQAAPDEVDVLAQVQAVRAALLRLGHTPSVLACDHDLAALERHLAASRPELVFNLVESLLGTSRLLSVVPSMLDALRVPYTGCSAEALFITTSKLLSKDRLLAAGLPTPDWRTPGRWHGTAPFSPGRFVIKSVWEHASIGLHDDAVIDGEDAAGLDRVIQERHVLFGGACFAERYIEGREINLGVLDGPNGPQLLPPAEIAFVDFPPGKPRIVGYEAKWQTESFEYAHTVRSFDVPDRSAPLFDHIARLTRAAWDLFELSGYARVDFRVDQAGQPQILEINANPCFSPDAGFAAGLAAGGIGYDDAVARLLSAATS